MFLFRNLEFCLFSFFKVIFGKNVLVLRYSLKIIKFKFLFYNGLEKVDGKVI